MQGVSLSTRGNVGFSALPNDTSTYGLGGPRLEPSTSGSGTSTLPLSHGHLTPVVTNNVDKIFISYQVDIPSYQVTSDTVLIWAVNPKELDPNAGNESKGVGRY